MVDDELARVDLLRDADGGDDGRAVLVGREELEPHRLDPFAARAAEAEVPLERRLEALLEDEAERDVQAADQRHGRREGGVELRLRLAHALPVEVVAGQAGAGRSLPRGLGDGDDGEPGRGHQRLLRAGDDHVHPPRVGLERDGAQARDRVADDERVAGRGRQCLDVGDDSGRRLGLRQEDDRRSGLVDPRAQVVGRGRLAPVVAELEPRHSRRRARSRRSARRSTRPRRRGRARRASTGWRSPTPSRPCRSRCRRGRRCASGRPPAAGSGAPRTARGSHARGGG